MPGPTRAARWQGAPGTSDAQRRAWFGHLGALPGWPGGWHLRCAGIAFGQGVSWQLRDVCVSYETQDPVCPPCATRSGVCWLISAVEVQEPVSLMGRSFVVEFRKGMLLGHVSGDRVVMEGYPYAA